MLDSYFHRTMPEVARHMPIPEEYSAMVCGGTGAWISYESIVYQLEPDVPEKLIWRTWAMGFDLAIRNGAAWIRRWFDADRRIISGRDGDIDPVC